MFSNSRISGRQLMRLMVVEIIGISTLIMTEIGVQYGARDGIISIIGAGILSYGYGWCIMWLCDRVKWDFWGLFAKNNMKLWKNFICIFFFIKYIFMEVILISVFTRILKMEVLEEISYIWIILSVIVFAIYGGSKSIESRGRMAECLFYVILIPVIIMMLLAVRGVDVYYMEPLFTNNMSIIIKGIILIFFLFSPLEIVLFQSGHISTEDDRKIHQVKRSIYNAITVVMIINIVMFVLNVGNLSINTILQDKASTIELMKTVKITGLIFEKQAGVYLVFYILSILTAITGLFAEICNLAERVCEKEKLLRIVTVSVLIGGGVFLIVNNSDKYKEVIAEPEKKVEIENRQYVDACVINYEKSKYHVALSYSDIEDKITSDKYELSNLYQLSEKYSEKSDKRLDFSNIQALVLDSEIFVKDKLFREVLKMIGNQPNFPENVNVFTTSGKTEDFMENGVMPGKYMSKICENNLSYGKTTLSDIKKVMNGSEEACVIAKFNVIDKEITSDGTLIYGKNGYVSEYTERDSPYIWLLTGNQGMYINMGGSSRFYVNKNKYYISEKIIGDDTIQVNILYSGKISNMSGADLSGAEVNELLEQIICGKLDLLKNDYECDLLNIYKYLGQADKKLWLRYRDNHSDMLKQVYFVVQAEYDVTD